jgi:hypothetical protein
MRPAELTGEEGFIGRLPYTGNQCYVYYNNGYINCNFNQSYPGCIPVGNPQGVAPRFNINVGGTQVPSSTALEDFAYNLAVRYAQVHFFGPMNEPNFTNMYNPPGGYTGTYLNDFMNYLVSPIRNGIKAANSNNQLVGPDVSIQSGSGATSGINSFLVPLNQYFSSSFDVWSVHSYHDDHTGVRDDMDTIWGDLGTAKPIWLTESGFKYNGSNSQSDNVQGLYVDEYNRQSWWTKTFYHQLKSGDYGLIDDNNNYRPAFYTYQTLYGR